MAVGWNFLYNTRDAYVNGKHAQLEVDLFGSYCTKWDDEIY